MKLLKEKLQDHLEKKNVNILAFESNAGLPRNAVYNIVSEKSKNPSIDNIVKIADALNCSVDSLFGREDYFKNYIRKHRSTFEYNSALFHSITKCVDKFLEKHKIYNTTLGDIFYSIEEIYEYSTSTTNGVLDEKFALWFLKNQFDHLIQ